MPNTIPTPDGETYWKVGWTGKALPAAAVYGIVPGEKMHGYWFHPWDDSRRLHAVGIDRWFLD
jgi:hypothetical protein